MKKILALLVSIVFLAVVITQQVNSVDGNPNWRPWEKSSPSNYPVINVMSPVEGGNYSSNDVWLNITVIKSDLLNMTGYQINSISHAVYTMISDMPYSKKLELRDTLDVVDESSSFNFSVNIAGLKDGVHTLWYNVNGVDGDDELSLNALTIDFTVYTPETESFPTSLVMATASVIIVVVLAVFLLMIKHKH